MPRWPMTAAWTPSTSGSQEIAVGMNEYLKAMHALAKLRMNADRMLAAAPTAEAKQWWDGYRQALHDMAVELSGAS